MTLRIIRPDGSSLIRPISYVPAGRVLPRTTKSNGIEARSTVPGSCARAVPEISRLKTLPITITLKSFFMISPLLNSNLSGQVTRNWYAMEDCEVRIANCEIQRNREVGQFAFRLSQFRDEAFFLG